MTNSHWTSFTASCGLALLLAACTGTPLRAPVAVDLPEVWRAPLPHDGSTVALTDWWKVFPDPMLVNLIERAQTANPNRQVAAADEATAALQAKWQTAVAEVEESLERMAATRDRQREAKSVASEWQDIAQRAVLQGEAGLYSGPQRMTSQHNALTAHDDLLTAQADHAQAWFRLYRSLGGGWTTDPNPIYQSATQP